MQQEDHDKTFFRSFGMVMGGLFGLFIVCVTAARTMTPAPAPDKAELARLDQRTAPIGQVVTDPKALLALAASKPARTPYTGQELVAKVCSACHQSGMLGAPKIGDKAEWSKREKAAGGIDGLTKVAIKGLNSMPPRGGDADLSDAEIKAGIEYMLSK